VSVQEASKHLLDRQELADLLIRYAAAIDQKDMDAMRALFVPEVEAVGFGRETIRGLDAWVAFVNRQIAHFHATQHMLGPQLAEIDGDEANTRTDLQATHWMSEPKGEVFTLWGSYLTRMQRTPDGWRISRHGLDIRGTKRDGFPSAAEAGF
jgi:ketosteroid isomerase-like protein